MMCWINPLPSSPITVVESIVCTPTDGFLQECQCHKDQYLRSEHFKLTCTAKQRETKANTDNFLLQFHIYPDTGRSNSLVIMFCTRTSGFAGQQNVFLFDDFHEKSYDAYGTII